MADSVYGNGSLSSGHQPHHAWQQVTDKKAKRRQEAKEKKSASSTANGSSTAVDSNQGVFAALDALEGRQAATRYEDDEEDRARHTDDSDEEELRKPANGISAEEKKPKQKKDKKPRVTVAEAASKIDPDDLLQFLEGVSDSFASNLEIQLMRCADYFARAFSSVTTASFQWHNILKENSLVKASEIPLSYVPEPVVKVTGDWLAKRPVSALSKFAVLLLKIVLEEDGASSKGGKQAAVAATGKTQVGILIVLAILLRRRPESLHQNFDTLNVGQLTKVPEQFATLQWTLAQIAHGDLAAALWLWARHLLPLAVAKNASPATRDTVLQFVENVILANPKKGKSVLMNAAGRKGQDRLVPPAALDQVTRAAFPVEAARTKATSRFEAIHPLIKELALTGASKSMKPVAAALLPLSVAEASADDNPRLSREAGDLFVWSLSQNVECFKQWEKLHLPHIQASSRLLAHILHQWPRFQSQLPALELSKTLKVLHEKHKAVLDGNFSGTVATTESEQTDVLTATRAAEAHVRALGRKLARFPTCFTFVALTVVTVGVLLAYLPIVETVDKLDMDSLRAEFEKIKFFN
ncbi:hypothetical protein KFL_000680180 [Klebsormidium nitens]|uniref:Transmembrane protein n=1 Tax=Klebsormidium nitens TaxID=105231 RepID=A0A0U9I6T8_KLENI|nr:hypothetical protein KFL_000680180 [Klebsormidium nitens]|eukprot:GAQ81002.1 hypothetical protein KFL_000680180 [Klebsormidium nitens]